MLDRTAVRSLALILAIATAPAAAVPVTPGASGFGVETPAGRGGTVYRVVNLNESGAGSLGACVAASGPRVCVFETSGTIRLSDDLVVRHPNLTIAGQTAPSPGIMLRGAALRIQASDVLVQHIRVRAGDDLAGPNPDNRDSLKVEGSAAQPVRNVVIDHCSFSWSLDEVASAWQYWQDISFLNNIFAEPLNDSLHPDGAHGYGVILGPVAGNAAMVGNLFAHQVERNPLSGAAGLVFVNNVVYNRANMDIDLQSQDGRLTDNSIVGNVFIRGPDYARDNRPVLMHAGAMALSAGSRVHLADNIAQEGTSDPWSLVALPASLVRSGFEALSPPLWPSGLTARRTANNAVLNQVLANAGARPADRDVVDMRVVQSVRNRNGGIINCVAADGSARCSKNGGGWPVLAVHARALTLPANPAGSARDGYTNLEVWLQAMNAEVEAAQVAVAPQPAMALRAQ